MRMGYSDPIMQRPLAAGFRESGFWSQLLGRECYCDVFEVKCYRSGRTVVHRNEQIVAMVHVEFQSDTPQILEEAEFV